jgi:hypothetical protein
VVVLAEGFEAGYFYSGSDAGRLYFQTTLGAPNGRVIATGFWMREIERKTRVTSISGVLTEK